MNSDNTFFLEKRAKFRYIKDLGSGGTGETKLAQDILTSTMYAIKKLSPSYENKDYTLGRFIKEIITLTKIYHYNIVRVYDYYLYEESNTGYIQMEYIDGEDINIFIKNSTNINIIDKLFTQALDAFKHLEESFILHRDIRFSNLLVDRNENLKIIDFGFGKIIDESIADSVLLNWPATQLPKEINSNNSVYDFKTEMYYLGVLFDKLWNENPEKIFSYKEVIKKMIKYDPNKRYNSFKEINEKLINDSFKMEFDKTEKECYIKFADFLTNTLSSFGETPIFRDKYQDIIFKLKEFYRSNQLENKIINFGNLVACFVENNSFTYNSNYTEDISVLANFLSLLLNSDEDKRKVLINHILNRISSITVSYDFPF